MIKYHSDLTQTEKTMCLWQAMQELDEVERRYGFCTPTNLMSRVVDMFVARPEVYFRG